MNTVGDIRRSATIDCFAPFVAGFVMQDVDVDKAIRVEWPKVCRALGRREEVHPDHLLFSSPNVMAAFTQHATILPELTAQVPLVKGYQTVKNREARLHRPAAIRPTEVRHVQQCVRWALKHGVGLTVVGGGHSGHCLWPNVVSVDMGAFDQVHILTAGEHGGDSGSDSGSLVVAEAGCKTGDIVRKTMAAGVTVPLGARPSLGAGLWLQGGIGHLARLHGLACDAIVGAVVVSVDSSQVLCVGRVPSQHRPAGAVRPENEPDLLWAIKGAGTNFGIVVSVTFKPYAAPTYLTRNWVVPLSDNLEARLRLSDFDKLVARKLLQNCSADAYLYWDERPRLPEEHFLNVVYGAVDVDVLLITGMRDEAPVAALSHLVPDSRLPEVHVQASEQTRRIRRGCHGGDGDGDDNKNSNNSGSSLTALDYCPSLIFDNDTTGNEAAKRFAEHYLLPFFHEDLQRLANMARPVFDFPCPGMEFRHVLGISQQPGGLALCTSLLQTHFTGDWAKVDAVACCEVGGFVYASALASRVDVPLVLIREAGKLPPPAVSVIKPPSYISSLASNNSKEKRIEMERNVVPRGASVVVVDDVLSTG